MKATIYFRVFDRDDWVMILSTDLPADQLFALYDPFVKKMCNTGFITKIVRENQNGDPIEVKEYGHP